VIRPLPRGVVRNEALKTPDGLRSFGYLGQPALDLAGAGANIAADRWKGDAFPDDRQPFRIPASDNKTKITRHINPAGQVSLHGTFMGSKCIFITSHGLDIKTVEDCPVSIEYLFSFQVKTDGKHILLEVSL